jgi:hypothetical protein
VANEPGLDGAPSAQGSQRAVFLSYASENVDAAQRICATLRAAGIEVWFDQSELRGGEAWDAAIKQQIKACALFVPIISAHTRSRAEGYFRLEWKLAVDRSHLMAADKAFLVPVVIDAVRDSDARVPDRFREVQWMRLPGGEASPNFVERVSQLLLPDGHAAASARQPAPNCHPMGPSPTAPPQCPPRQPRKPADRRGLDLQGCRGWSAHPSSAGHANLKYFGQRSIACWQVDGSWY